MRQIPVRRPDADTDISLMPSCICGISRCDGRIFPVLKGCGDKS